MRSLKHVVCLVDKTSRAFLVVRGGSGNKTLDKIVDGVSLVEMDNCILG